MKKFNLSVPDTIKVKENEASFLLASKLYETGKVTLKQAMKIVEQGTLSTGKSTRGRKPKSDEEGYDVLMKSQTNNIIYLECANKFTVDVPMLGDEFKPEYIGKNMEILYPDENNKKEVTIIPESKFSSLTVKSTSHGTMVEIDTVKFSVFRPPRPEIQLIVNGKKYDGTSGIKDNSHCLIKIKSDTDFANNFPDDCKYEIDKVELMKQEPTDTKPPLQLAEYTGKDYDPENGLPINLADHLSNEQSGTRIYFKIHNIYRVNCQGRRIEENFKGRDLIVSSIIK